MLLFITLSILNVSVRYVSILAMYHLKADLITQTMCENRFDPSEMCQGRCYLQKELVKATQSAPDEQAPMQTRILPVSWCSPMWNPSGTTDEIFTISHSPAWKNSFFGLADFHDIDHPPEIRI